MLCWDSEVLDIRPVPVTLRSFLGHRILGSCAAAVGIDKKHRGAHPVKHDLRVALSNLILRLESRVSQQLKHHSSK